MGGADIYRQTLAMAHRWELTFIHDTYDGDAYFPAYDALLPQFDRVAAQSEGLVTYVTYVRRGATPVDGRDVDNKDNYGPANHGSANQ